MAYKALYRTYRPNSFDEVAGQKHVVQTLHMLICSAAPVVQEKHQLRKSLRKL